MMEILHHVWLACVLAVHAGRALPHSQYALGGGTGCRLRAVQLRFANPDLLLQVTVENAEVP